MNYYQIALPVYFSNNLIYSSKLDLIPGLRVIVSLNKNLLTGFVQDKIALTDLKDKYKYKEIQEVIDQTPLLPENLFKLALWISEYYHSPLGIVLNAMIPSSLNVENNWEVKLTEILSHPDPMAESILKLLNPLEFTKVTELRDKITSNKFYYWLEELEKSGHLQIKRSYEHKLKKKVANFIIIQHMDDIPSLTGKQQSAMDLFKEIGGDVPVSSIVEEVSYAILKALREKGLIKIEPRTISEIEIDLGSVSEKKNITYTDEQLNVIEILNNKLHENKFSTYLLYGITGSGKTEIYIELIKTCLAKGKTALMLVPEIALTPQMVNRFFQAFEEGIAILHSHLNERQKWQQWNKIKNKECRIVIGARSAIFAPLENIGVIIVDEEHETSYKQENQPMYNGRDTAIVRARFNNALCVLGSATPALESWLNSQQHKSELLTLTKRPLDITLPSIKLIDLRKENPESLLTEELVKTIEEKLLKKEQVILFQNRRGHSSFVQCVTCGNLLKCQACDISLTFHSRENELVCHYCGYTQNVPRNCPKCNGYIFSFGAPGTEKIEKELKQVFPQARILRMDADTTQKKESYNYMFDAMRKGEVDILLGTQMISKGLDFPNVTLVGVILADISLNVPDFRASERTFQLLTQVAGRSGRGDKKGEVIIQAYNPEHYAIQFALKKDFAGFVNEELRYRKELKYPPYYKIARILFSHQDLEFLKDQTEQFQAFLEGFKMTVLKQNVHILGIVPAPLTKINNVYRFHLIIKAETAQSLNSVVNYLKEKLVLSTQIRMSVDIDPITLL